MTSRVLSLRASARLASSAHVGYHRQSIIRFKSSRSDPQKLYDSVNELFVSLRWKAANVLTESLSLDERGQLLERYSPPNPDETEAAAVSDEQPAITPAAHTIAEAVAAAQAKEAQRQEGQWEERKEAIFEEARQAAQARVESDFAIQKSRLEKMKNEFELEKEKLADAPAAEKKLVEVEVVQNEDAHPVLGPVVVDLGYKRIHRVSAKALSAIPVWEKQRVYRHDRAKKMAEDKMKSLHLGMPGIIGLHEVSRPMTCLKA
jgi:hypothetical protein